MVFVWGIVRNLWSQEGLQPPHLDYSWCWCIFVVNANQHGNWIFIFTLCYMGFVVLTFLKHTILKQCVWVQTYILHTFVDPKSKKAEFFGRDFQILCLQTAAACASHHQKPSSQGTERVSVSK